MTSPKEVAAFHAEYDHHADERVHLFEAVANFLPSAVSVLYPGSYVDIAPSVWFDQVTYVDIDKRTPRFFAERDAVADLVQAKRQLFNPDSADEFSVHFHHLDYQTELPSTVEQVDVLVSLYAGFVSEHCTQHLRVGGTLLVNSSHGDAAMASIDPRYKLCGVVTARDGRYRVTTERLDEFLVAKKAQDVSAETLHAAGRGIAYTKPAFAYLFTRVLHPIGYWLGPDDPGLPDPVDLIDESWDSTERDRVGAVLAAEATHAAGEGCSLCRICGAPNGFVDLTDGTYVWPEGLAHYVADHGVRLPAEVVAGLLRPSR